jgi:hypothetical protein
VDGRQGNDDENNNSVYELTSQQITRASEVQEDNIKKYRQDQK